MARVENTAKQKYVALTGITIETGKRSLRIEAGGELPADVAQVDITDLLEIKAIKVKDDEGGDLK